ncbi:hypothetical protein B0H10DRAFT_2187333 [Mycena sp. CBHHK59/15]|nr:hypothetical protein B0H10DRAFT_2187333 [Mycena sp. CBHHK59/15]
MLVNLYFLSLPLSLRAYWRHSIPHSPHISLVKTFPPILVAPTMPPFSSPFHRNTLLRTKQYAASTLFPSSFTFVKDGHGHTLSDILPGPLDPDAPAAPHTVAIVIGVVTESKMFLTPAGSHLPGGQFPKKFAKAKYVFMVTKPVDFPVKINALKKYQTSISKTGVNKWFISKDGSDDAFRFATPVFQKKDKDPGAGELHDISTWPVHTDLRGELDKLVEEYSVRDFPVYDTDHNRVDPVHIQAKMKGALVECSFRLLHYNFGGPDDSFVGEIVQVVILRPKAQQPPSPYKSSPNKPYRPAALSAAEIHAEQQRAVGFFTPPIVMPPAGPSNLAAPTRNFPIIPQLPN